MKKNREKKDFFANIEIVGLPLLIFFVWLITCWELTYQVHDDRYMMEFVSGKFLGYSDAHLIYIKYPLAVCLQVIYGLFPKYDWYATMLLMIQIAMLGIWNWYLVKKQKTVKIKILSTIAFYSLFIFCWINEMTCFTYTTVAALVGAVIVVVYALGEDTKKDFIVILVLSFLAYNLRQDVFFMVIPVCGAIWLYKYIEKKEKKQIVLLFALSVVIGISFIVEQVAYSSPEWKEYREYNKARTKVYDYYYEELIDYETHGKMYKQLEISKNEYETIKAYDLSLYDLELFEKVEALSESYIDQTGVIEKFKQGLQAVVLDGFMKSKMQAMISGILWFVAIGYTIYRKDKKVACLEMAILLIHGILWIYLGIGDRILPRVSHSMLLLQIATSFSLLYIQRQTEKVDLKGLKRIVSIAFIVLILGTSVYDVVLCRKWISRNQFETENEDHYIIEEYCNAHHENFYFLDVFSVVETRYNYNFKNPNAYENFISLGDWYANSPLYTKKIDGKKIKSVRDAVLNNENVYVIALKDKNLDYIKELTQKEVTIEAVEDLKKGEEQYTVYNVSVVQ